MTKLEFQVIEMLGRVVAFVLANHDKFPPKSLAGSALAVIEAAITKMYELAQLQDKRNLAVRVEQKEAAREALTAQLEAIQQTSLGVSMDQPGTDVLFRLPARPRRDRALIQIGEQFVKHVGPLKQAFVEHSLPKDFVDQLKDAVENFRQAINSHTVAKAARSSASIEMWETLNEAMAHLQRLESIVNNSLRDDPAALAAWQVARHVTKVRKKPEKTATTEPPAVPVPPPEGGEAAQATP